MTKTRPLFALLVTLTLTACASFWLSGGMPLLKVAPSTLGERTVEQRLILSWPNEQRTMEAVLDVRADALTVIGMAFGARLFSFDYNGKRIVETQPLPGNLSATRIMNDLLLAYAPLDALRAALPVGWTVHEKQGIRQVFLDEALNISVLYPEGSLWQGRVVLDNHALRYQVTFDSREVVDDAP